MKKSFAIVLGIALFTSCADSTPVEHDHDHDHDHEKEMSSDKEIIDVTPNHMLTMEITGMSCEMACGGAIREGLIEAGGVSRVQYIDFDMDEETNVAKIYFDDSKISESKIVEIVSALNKKQFTVGKTRNDVYSEPTSSLEYPKSKSNSESEKATVTMSSSVVELPNLFDILRSIVHN